MSSSCRSMSVSKRRGFVQILNCGNFLTLAVLEFLNLAWEEGRQSGVEFKKRMEERATTLIWEPHGSEDGEQRQVTGRQSRN